MISVTGKIFPPEGISCRLHPCYQVFSSLKGPKIKALQGSGQSMAPENANRNPERFAELTALLRSHGDLVLQSLTDPVCVLDDSGILLEASDSFCHLLEFPRSELLGSHASSWDSRIASPRRGGCDFPEGRQPALFRRRDASLIPVEAEYAFMKLDDHCLIHLSARLTSEDFLQSSNSFLFENNAAAILLLDQNGRIRKGNAAFWRMTGYKAGEICGLSFELLFAPPEAYQKFLLLLHQVLLGKNFRSSLRLRKRDGTLLWAEMTGSPAPMEDRKDGAMLVILDMTDFHDTREKLERRLSEDPLTGLPNRHGLEGALSGALARARRKGTVFAVCALDIDDFRPINDRLGPEKGDVILGELARRLRSQLRGSDFVARIGGDEFGLVIEDLSMEKTTSQLSHVLNRIHQAIETSFPLDKDEKVRINISMGIALFPSNGEDGDTLIRQADAALYQSKSSKGSRSQWWSFGA
ncbi:MAG: diguanylate cyclase/phosphodiesterase with GAF sensor, partial [Leptospirillum sp. Group IV 'UBA BS']